MQLNEEQKKQVAMWFAGGESLSDLQKKIAAEFGIGLTYLDVRLLVAELPQPEEKEEEKAKEEGEGEGQGQGEGVGEGVGDAEGEGVGEGQGEVQGQGEGAALGEVMVEMDAIVIPGAMASGAVTFSDGTKGKWYLDQMGRLGLADIAAGYRPSPEDAAAFQSKLVELLRAKGMM